MLANVNDNPNPWFDILASILAWSSGVINPFIYAASNRTYRIAYYNLLSPLKFWGEPMSPMPSKTPTPSKGSKDGNNSRSPETNKDIKNGISVLKV